MSTATTATTQMVTEREAVRRERAAAYRAYNNLSLDGFINDRFAGAKPLPRTQMVLEKMYPEPTETKDNVVLPKGSEFEYRVKGGDLQYRFPLNGVWSSTRGAIFPAQVDGWGTGQKGLRIEDARAILALFDTPTVTQVVDGPMVSEVDVRRREREAARRALPASDLRELEYGTGHHFTKAEVDQAIDKVYPMPKVTQPREITLHGCKYRVVDGVLQVRDVCGSWTPSRNRVNEFGAEGMLKIAELIENPTREVVAA